eukprot:3764513-Alexandrium_andersonii.AAC.1
MLKLTTQDGLGTSDHSTVSDAHLYWEVKHGRQEKPEGFRPGRGRSGPTELGPKLNARRGLSPPSE